LPTPFFVLTCPPYLRHLPSFPTRRSSDLRLPVRHVGLDHLQGQGRAEGPAGRLPAVRQAGETQPGPAEAGLLTDRQGAREGPLPDRKSTRLNSSHQIISYAVFCLKKKKKT